MKGLILKDLYMAAHYFKTYLLILVSVIGISVVKENNLFFAFYPLIICAMLPVSLLGYDERNRWDIYCGTLPVTRDMVVSSKYLLSLILQVSVLVIICLIQAAQMLIRGTFQLESYLVLVALLVIISLVSSSVSLPFMFKLGVEKGRTAYYVAIGLICGGGMLSGTVFEKVLQTQISLGAVLALLVLLSAGFFTLSWYLAIRFYRNRELH